MKYNRKIFLLIVFLVEIGTLFFSFFSLNPALMGYKGIYAAPYLTVPFLYLLLCILKGNKGNALPFLSLLSILCIHLYLFFTWPLKMNIVSGIDIRLSLIAIRPAFLLSGSITCIFCIVEGIHLLKQNKGGKK